MVGVFFFQLIINAFIFSFIFWALTFVAKRVYSAKYYDYKLNFYECGFKNLTLKRPVYELNFVMVVLFLLIYDGEFLLLIPFSLNAGFVVVELCMFFLFFLIWFVLTLLLDYVYVSLEWQV
jgi:NADH:ubiquinone oxidoreductase subunit 3 (subunit A)